MCAFYFYKLIGKLTAFFAASGVPLPYSTSDQFHYRREEFSCRVKSKIVNILANMSFVSTFSNFFPLKKASVPAQKASVSYYRRLNS
jgi:hypothetical protein